MMMRLVDACCLALLSTLSSDPKALLAVADLSWQAADAHVQVMRRASVSEVLMRCRAIKAAAAAGDTSRVVSWGTCCHPLF
jgi:hypothetical protein